MRADKIGRNRDQRTTYEVYRHRERGEKRVERPPVVEEFLGLDRARIAALAFALDGPIPIGKHFTEKVEVFRLRYVGEKLVDRVLVDVLDEHVPFRVLNELTLPRVNALSVPIERLQEEGNRLARLGI